MMKYRNILLRIFTFYLW